MEKNIFERAFELAPGCDTMDQLRAALKREGYTFVEQHFEGRQIKAQIAGMLRGRKLRWESGQAEDQSGT